MRTLVTRVVQTLTVLILVGAIATIVLNYSQSAQVSVGAAVNFNRHTRDPLCPAWHAYRATRERLNQERLVAEMQARCHRRTSESGLELWDTPAGQFWIPAGNVYDLTLNMLEIEHKSANLQKADVVLDCGAHLGIYTRRALDAGAALVVAIEPSPDNLKCLRRTFAEELASGKVILYEKGVWDREDTLMLTLAPIGTAGDTLVRTLPTSRGSVAVALTTLDQIVTELKLPRVDVIKMDIEGAEPRALRGAASTINRYRPRLFISGYHEPTDSANIQDIVSSARQDYRLRCDDCVLIDGRISPQTLQFF